jgi:hypothetical protein
MLRVWGVGIAILVGAQAALAVCVYANRMPELLVPLLRCSTPLAALACSLLAPRHKLLSGILIAIPATLLLVLLNAVYQLLSIQSDFPGMAGALSGAEMGLIFNTVYCTLGALAGYALSKGRDTVAA